MRLSRSEGLLYGASLWNLPLKICIAEYKDLWPMSIAVPELSSHLMVWIGSHQPTILCSCHTFLGNSYGQVPQLSPARKYHKTYHKMLKANSSKYKDKCQDASRCAYVYMICLSHFQSIFLSSLLPRSCTFLAIRTSIRPSVYDLKMCHSTRHTCNNLRNIVDKVCQQFSYV